MGGGDLFARVSVVAHLALHLDLLADLDVRDQLFLEKVVLTPFAGYFSEHTAVVVVI